MASSDGKQPVVSTSKTCVSHHSSLLLCYFALTLSPQEDMNLNEDRKAPLRGKDLSTKREMVVQYISATSKSVSNTAPSHAPLEERRT